MRAPKSVTVSMPRRTGNSDTATNNVNFNHRQNSTQAYVRRLHLHSNIIFSMTKQTLTFSTILILSIAFPRCNSYTHKSYPCTQPAAALTQFSTAHSTHRPAQSLQCTTNHQTQYTDSECSGGGKLKVLCLHDYLGSAAQLQAQLQPLVDMSCDQFQYGETTAAVT